MARQQLLPFFIILSFCAAITGALFAQDSDFDREAGIVSAYSSRTILLNKSTIDTLLNSPLTLDDCVAISLKNNVLLQIDRLEYNRVYFDTYGSKQNYYPEIGLSAERNLETEIDSIGNDGAETTSDQLDLSLIQRMPLGGSISFSHQLARSTDNVGRGSDDPGKLWTLSFSQPLLQGFGYDLAYSDVKQADLGFQIEQYRLKSAILETIFLVKEAYFNVLRLNKLVASTEAAIERDNQLIRISEAKVEAKLATRRDILSAEIILQQDYAELVQNQADLQNAYDELKNTMGVSFEKEIQLAVSDMEYRPIPIDETYWLEVAQKNNTDIQLVEASLQLNEFQSKIAKNSRLPNLAIEGSVSRLYDNDPQDNRNRDLTGRVVLSYPLFNYGARADYQQSVIAKRQTERVLENTRRVTLLNVRSAIRNLRNGNERLKILLKSIDAAREKVVFATSMFNMGRASNQDITDAQEDLLDAEVDYAEELSSYYIEQARLEQLLGGFTVSNQ